MIIDFHTHIFPDKIANRAIETLEKSANYECKAVFDGSLSGLLKVMDESNISKSVICSIATKPSQVSDITNWSISIKSDRILPLGSIHPEYNNIEDELKKLKDNGITGIKLHPQYQNYDITDKNYFRIYEKVVKHNFFILFHAGYDIAFDNDERSSPDRIEKIKINFPEITLILAHLGGWKDWKRVDYFLTKYTDIYFDISYSLDYIDKNLLNTILKKIKIENILFGSDTPWQHPKITIELVKQNFAKSDWQKIFYDNGLNFLNKMRYEI